MAVFPIVLDTPFGIGIEDEEKIRSQDWFVNFSDFFGSMAVWVDRSCYFEALSFMKDNNFSVLCV